MAGYQTAPTVAKRRRRWPWLVIIILVALGVVAGLHALKPDTQLSTAPTVNGTINPDAVNRAWQEPAFKISLPGDWLRTSNTAEHYAWRGGQAGVDDSRTLEVYVGGNTGAIAVNRLLKVTADGSGIRVDGDVSDNCFNFVGSGVHTPGEQPRRAQWNKLPFICDLANYQRDVVGTISADGLNSVKLKGSGGGQQRFFFVYTDSSYVPDYGIFTAALESFQAR